MVSYVVVPLTAVLFPVARGALFPYFLIFPVLVVFFLLNRTVLVCRKNELNSLE